MSEQENNVQVTINGRQMSVPESLSSIDAVWHAGLSQIEGVGCLEGVCGSCKVMVRRAGSTEVTTELGCQTYVEDGMEIIFLSFSAQVQHHYQLTDIKSSWDVQSQFHQIFPEASRCRSCGGCNRSCPKDIEVENGVKLAAKGRFREAGDLFIECVMCDLCKTACPERISPNHVGLFCRRVDAYFHIRPSNLINRLEKIRRGGFAIEK